MGESRRERTNAGCSFLVRVEFSPGVSDSIQVKGLCTATASDPGGTCTATGKQRLESSDRPVPVSHFPSKHSDCEEGRYRLPSPFSSLRLLLPVLNSWVSLSASLISTQSRVRPDLLRPPSRRVEFSDRVARLTVDTTYPSPVAAPTYHTLPHIQPRTAPTTGIAHLDWNFVQTKEPRFSTDLPLPAHHLNHHHTTTTHSGSAKRTVKR